MALKGPKSKKRQRTDGGAAFGCLAMLSMVSLVLALDFIPRPPITREYCCQTTNADPRKGYGIRTGLSDLLKPLNSEAGVTLKEDSIPTILVMTFGIVMLALWFILLLLINNQSVLLPPEDEFDEYVANFLPYFFFGEK